MKNKEKIALLRAQLDILPSYEGVVLITATTAGAITGIPSQTIQSRILSRGLIPRIDIPGIRLFAVEEIISALENPLKAGRKPRKEAQ